MGIKTDRLSRTFRSFIDKQAMFFVATAAANGRVNLSPKGMDFLRVVSDQKIVWLSLTGSGNETAAHLLQDPRMTLMFCAFEGDALILRTYGQANAIHPRDAEWYDLYALFPDYASARNIFTLNINLVTTSCGTGIPEMTMVRSRGKPSWSLGTPTWDPKWWKHSGKRKTLSVWIISQQVYSKHKVATVRRRPLPSSGSTIAKSALPK